MYDVQLRTWSVVWYGIQEEPDWEDEEWEEEEFSLRVTKRRKGNWSIRRDSKNS